MGVKTPPCPMYPEWTTAKFNAFIISALRAAHNKWPPMLEAKERARRDIPKAEQKERGIKHRKEYQCACCGKWDKEMNGRKQNFQVDHIVPVGTTKIPLGEYIYKLFRPTEDYQLLCTDCHKVKSKEDRAAIRRGEY